MMLTQQDKAWLANMINFAVHEIVKHIHDNNNSRGEMAANDFNNRLEEYETNLDEQIARMEREKERWDKQPKEAWDKQMLGTWETVNRTNVQLVVRREVAEEIRQQIDIAIGPLPENPFIINRKIADLQGLVKDARQLLNTSIGIIPNDSGVVGLIRDFLNKTEGMI